VNPSPLYQDAELNPSSLAEVAAQASFAAKLRQCPARFGQRFEQLPLATQNGIILQRLQQLIQSMRLNPWHRQRFEAAGVTGAPASFADWQRLPITDRDTLHDLYMGERPGLVLGMDQGGFQVVASGGTSGGLPIETVYSTQELNDSYELAGQFLGRHLLPQHLDGPGPRWLITTLYDSEMWSSGSMLGGVFTRTPGINFIAAGAMGQLVFDHVMSFPGPKAVMGMSRELEALIPLGASLSQAARDSFQLAIYGSGIITRKRTEELHALFPNLRLVSYFASNQAEAIGQQLGPGAPLTAVPGLHLIEIVDGDGRWVAEGEEGELVITRLHAKEAPVLRMQLGDRMIRRPALVSPELVAEQFEFAGRSSDILHLDESHFAARPSYEGLCQRIRAACGVDLDGLAHAVQFRNDRGNKVLHLVAAVDQPAELDARLRSVCDGAAVRGLFLATLKATISFFDQDESHYAALDRTPYAFDVRLVAPGAPEIYRTRVNKVPLIRDIL
jgi:phenylacetate-CoA ligase